MDSPLRDMNKEKKKLVLTGVDYGYKSYPPTKVDESSYEKGKIAGRDLERMTIMKELAPLLEKENESVPFDLGAVNRNIMRERIKAKLESQ